MTLQLGRVLGVLVVGIIAALLFATSAQARPASCVIRDGKLYVDGEWVFLKIGKPLRDFAKKDECEQLAKDLDVLQARGYNCLELNCYWHHFDKDGDGTPDVSLEPLRKLIDAVCERGMFACLAIETYGVGGGTVPAGFWERHPDALAINSDGKEVRDTEYGFGSAVPSLFSPGYLETSRKFIRELTGGLDHEKLLYFETTVEPQFIGNQTLDFSANAHKAYLGWLDANKVDGPEWPTERPVPAAFLLNPVWLRFKAEALADWVNKDAAAFRDVAGPDAYIAMDYLETCGPEMPNRNGDSLVFLTNLTSVDIMQVNWHWHLRSRGPNQCAYDKVKKAMKDTGRNWAITEHMTFNGSDYRPEEAEAMLRNTLAQGTRFGWEFVTVSANKADPFSLYNDDWSPKPLIAVVDDNWTRWQEEIRAGE